MRTLILHAYHLSVCLSIQHMAVLVPSLSPPWSFQTQQGAVFHPQLGLHLPASCPLVLHVLTRLCRPSPPSWPMEHSRWLQLEPGHLLCSLPGHSSPRGIRLNGKFPGGALVRMSPLGERRGRGLAWGMTGFSHGLIVNRRRVPEPETMEWWLHSLVSVQLHSWLTWELVSVSPLQPPAVFSCG